MVTAHSACLGFLLPLFLSQTTACNLPTHRWGSSLLSHGCRTDLEAGDLDSESLWKHIPLSMSVHAAVAWAQTSSLLRKQGVPETALQMRPGSLPWC